MSASLPDNSAVYAHDADEESFDWQRLLGIVRRRRKIIGFTLAGVLSLAGIYLVLSPKIYKASADLLINTEQKSSSQGLGSLPAITDLLGATGTRSQDTEVEILRSAVVQDAATALVPNAMRPAVKKNIRVDIQPKRSTDIITVNVQSRDPKLAITYSNAICEAYRLQNQQNNSAQYRETADYVGGQLAMVRKKLDQKRDELRKFKEGSGIVDLPTESQARVARLNELQTAFQGAEADRTAGEAQLKTLRAQAAQMAPAEIAPSTIVVRPVVQQLKQQLTTLETQRAATSQEFMPGAIEVKTLDDQITALRRRLQTEASTEVGTYTRNINPVRQAVMQSISSTLAGVWSAQARAEALRANIVRAQQTVQQLPQREYRLSQLQGDLATYQQTFQSLSDKYQTLLISQKTPIANARVITPADEALKVSPRVASTLVLAVVGGLLLAMVIAVAVDGLDNKIYTEEDAVQATGLPVLTHVPMLGAQSGQQLLIDKADSSILLESFRMLRTQLSFISSYGHLKTLVLTSSQPGEGKSTVSANLAIALALNGKRVVLVDADLRRPRVHTLFGIEKTKGFTSVVANVCSLEEALHQTETEGLQVLPSGPTPPNPSELLDSRAAREIIEQLKATADYVIIDAPPALMLADAQIISSVADGVLLVVSCQEAKRGAVERTCELMGQTGVKIVGMVLNKFTDEQGGYYGYYGYKYGGYSAYLEDKALSKHDNLPS
ncbi:GumC family protein [Abditibacterium utsteinense]|uniref:GumC family protein n=1 Tax=Abditibacterium utsteinense TaxID=1960156 RepID=UPI0014765CCC|nr:polysaccharide biosynthesis tyrosine autokinase [Abditibacterium utsteinense]